MINKSLIPIKGAFVKHLISKRYGVVLKCLNSTQGTRLQVRWQQDTGVSLVQLEEISCGLVPGQEVLDRPRSDLHTSFGLGRVEQIRSLGGHEQALVDFWEERQRLWLPWQNLHPVPSVEADYKRAKTSPSERLRLRNLAYALEEWHKNTGALSKLDIDPLPHQLHLVHRILASGNLNWLIADDVGLGKTIEVGLLLSALKKRGFKRFLIIVPAGLTTQWQEEMRDKFELGDFQIYGRDFSINDLNHWKLRDCVIASIDLVKGDPHLGTLRQSGHWDLVVFDEAHRLSRSQYGNKLTATERYRLARQLRRQTENVVLLSGTPHQGKTDRFKALLELLRVGPQWRDHLNTLEVHPEILREMIIRNRKAEVIDTDGNFIFRGKETQTIQVSIGEPERQFNHALLRYLREGYSASRYGGQETKAIGFVMTIYRKLASSSICAIQTALVRRRSKLLNSSSAVNEGFVERAAGFEIGDIEDSRFVEQEESLETRNKEFFSGEIQQLNALLDVLGRIRKTDSKLHYLLNNVIKPILRQNSQEKLLIFTEYRSTQDYLLQALSEGFGPQKVSIIRGGQSLEERKAAIFSFETDGQFLISTEAGGEGLNLQRECHIMINYDLPWNPMRLVQRVGRLYRYGQDKKVIVINLKLPDTIDSDILELMYDRLEQVSFDMASVAEEYKEGLKEDILGELVSYLDIESLLENALINMSHSQEQLEEALRRAREAVELQDELLSFASRFNPEEFKEDLLLSLEHLKRFIEGMCEQTSIRISQKTYQSQVWHLQLPAEIQEAIDRNQNIRICFDRKLASRIRSAELINAEHPLLQYLLKKAKSYFFEGRTATLNSGFDDAGLCAILRWQNDRGVILNQEYVHISLSGTEASINSKAWSDWLLEPSSTFTIRPKPTSEMLVRLKHKLNQVINKRSNVQLLPDTYRIISAYWNYKQDTP